jgi:hypothetical protein
MSTANLGIEPLRPVIADGSFTSHADERTRLEAARRSMDAYQTEIDRKNSWLRKIPLIGRPLDATWGWMKRHPVVSTFLGLGLGATILGWYYGYLGNKLLDYLPNYSDSVNRVGREAAIPTTPDMALGGEGVGAVIGATSPPGITPLPTPTPSPTPGIFAAPPTSLPPPTNTLPVPSPSPSPMMPPSPQGGAGRESL